MRNIWIIILALFYTGCARVEFLATPTNEIATITYKINTPQLKQTWFFVNNDLTVKYSKQNSAGKVITSKTSKLTPNDFNWLVTEINKTNYAKIKSPSKAEALMYIDSYKRQLNAPEVLSIATLSETHTFQRKGNVGLPPKLAVIAQKIPTIFVGR